LLVFAGSDDTTLDQLAAVIDAYGGGTAHAAAHPMGNAAVMGMLAKVLLELQNGNAILKTVGGNIVQAANGMSAAKVCRQHHLAL
jgi:hypothetical protein